MYWARTVLKSNHVAVYCTDKKENEIFLEYKEIHSDWVQSHI